MTHIRIRWLKLGGHVHVGVWSGTSRGATHGCNGRLVFREDEWEHFVRLMRSTAYSSTVEIVAEEEPLPDDVDRALARQDTLRAEREGT